MQKNKHPLRHFKVFFLLLFYFIVPLKTIEMGGDYKGEKVKTVLYVHGSAAVATVTAVRIIESRAKVGFYDLHIPSGLYVCLRARLCI